MANFKGSLSESFKVLLALVIPPPTSHESNLKSWTGRSHKLPGQSVIDGSLGSVWAVDGAAQGLFTLLSPVE